MPRLRLTLCLPRWGRRSDRPRRSDRRRRPFSLHRVLVRLAVVAGVALGGLLLYLNVTLARRFEGRLWMLPSNIYSDVLLVAPGDALDGAELAARLDRSGYARTASEPTKPGQYTREGPTLDVYRRGFEAAGFAGTSRRLKLRFGGGRLASIRDADGQVVDRAIFEPELVATLFGPRQEERHPVRLAELPDRLRDAVIAAEDGRFFAHSGLDLRGILRASWANLQSGRIVQGGSTITQQTIKNLFLDQERTWWRKAREALYAAILDARYAKERILEVYLNEVYLGQRGPVAICGVQAAARFYFGRDAKDLSLGESALLAGLIRSPGRYNPFVDRARARERRDQVLEAMERLELVDAAAAQAARVETIELASGSSGFTLAPYAVDYVRAQLTELYSSETLRWEGLRIYTTLDTLWQTHAERALKEGLARLDRGRRRRAAGKLQGAVLVLEPSSGAILAMIGGRDYTASQFNRAVQARRQPGSCLKPLVYATGFELAVRGAAEGLTPTTLLDDSPIEMVSGGQTWRPENYDGEFRGWVTVRTALEQSLNVPTVRAAVGIGLDRIIETLKRLGVESPLAEVPSLALGANEVTPLELAGAYAALARQGRAGRPWIVREIVDRDGDVLFRPRVTWSGAISPQAAYLVNEILRGVLREGTARSAADLGYSGDAAGKTGTTDDTRDSWFVGYTPERLCLVWVGYDDNARTGLTGASGALPIWVDLMRRAGEAEHLLPEEVPEGIIARRVDPESGGLALHACPRIIEEHFLEGTEPERDCVLHGGRLRRWFHKLRGKPSYGNGVGV